MSDINYFKNACRVCLNVPTGADLLLFSANLEEKLDFIQGSLKNTKCHQVPKYICSKCKAELEGVHKFFVKLKSSNLRIEHANVPDEEHDTHRVVKTEVVESENEHCELENENGESVTEFIHEIKVEEVTTEEDYYNVHEDNIIATTIKINCNQKKQKGKPRKDLKTKICDICDKAFSYRSNLVRHLQEHQGRRFVCDYGNCNLFFTQKCAVKQHMVVHTGERRFACDVCNKTFTQRKSLVIHSKIHRNERSYECDRCKKSFIQIQNWKRHLLKMSCKVDRSTKFQCTHCHNYYATKQSLQRHYKRHEVKIEVPS